MAPSPLGELEQLRVQLPLDARPLLPQVQRTQRDVSPVRVHDQARVRRGQQLGGGRERRDRARDPARILARYRGQSGRFVLAIRGGDVTGHFHMFWVVFCMLQVRHAISEDRKTDERQLPL